MLPVLIVSVPATPSAPEFSVWIRTLPDDVPVDCPVVQRTSPPEPEAACPPFITKSPPASVSVLVPMASPATNWTGPPLPPPPVWIPDPVPPAMRVLPPLAAAAADVPDWMMTSEPSS